MKKLIAIIMTAALLLTAAVALAENNNSNNLGPGSRRGGWRGSMSFGNGMGGDPFSMMWGMGCWPGMGGCPNMGGAPGQQDAEDKAPEEAMFSIDQIREILDRLVFEDEITRKQADLILKSFEKTEDAPEEAEEALDEFRAEAPDPEEETEEGVIRGRGGKHHGKRAYEEPEAEEFPEEEPEAEELPEEEPVEDEEAEAPVEEETEEGELFANDGKLPDLFGHKLPEAEAEADE